MPTGTKLKKTQEKVMKYLIVFSRRVLDGEPAGFGSFPWQALIRVGKGKCGGVLVNRRHVVTAGHCVKNKVLSSVVVTLGEYHLKSSREPLPDQTFRVIKAVVHPRFQFSPAADRYDVAVLRLDRPVRYAPHIAPICLPEIGNYRRTLALIFSLKIFFYRAGPKSRNASLCGGLGCADSRRRDRTAD